MIQAEVDEAIAKLGLFANESSYTPSPGYLISPESAARMAALKRNNDEEDETSMVINELIEAGYFVPSTPILLAPMNHFDRPMDL